MVAAVKASRIPALTESNAMPKWWTTDMWRLQFPQESTALYDFDMTSIRKSHTPSTKMRYCPPYAVGNKSGCPKKDKRMKSCLEGNTPKRKATKAETINSEQKKKKSKKSKSGVKQLRN